MVSSYSLRIEYLWFLSLFDLQCIAENSITRCADHTSLQFIYKLVDFTSIYLMIYSWSAHIHCALSTCDFCCLLFSDYGGKLNNSMRRPYFTAIYFSMGRSYQYLSNDLFMVSSYSLRIELMRYLLLFVFKCLAENSITRCADHTSLQFIFQWVDLTSIYLMTYWLSAHIHCALSSCDFCCYLFFSV